MKSDYLYYKLFHTTIVTIATEDQYYVLCSFIFAENINSTPFHTQAEGRAVRRVRIMCRNMDSLQMEMRVVQVALPTGCMCRPCAAVGDKVPDVLNPTQHKVMDILAFEKKDS